MITMDGTRAETSSSSGSSAHPPVASAPKPMEARLPRKVSRHHFWQIPLLVILGTVCAGGGAWLLASGQMAFGFGAWVALLGCAYGASRSEPGNQDDFDLATSRPVKIGKLGHKDKPAPTQTPVAVTKVNWRCHIAVNPESQLPADLLVLTTSGVDLISTAPEAWEGLGNQNLTMALTSRIVFDAIDGSRSWRDLADIELSRFDAFVAEHGYDAVAKASAPTVSYDQDSIAFAGVYRRRFVSSSYFEVELFDGTTDRRDLIADDDRLDALRNQLSYLGYQQRFRESGQVA